MPTLNQALKDQPAYIEKLRVRNAKLEKLLQKVLDNCDSDWWAELDQMTKDTPFDITVPVGLLWEINDELMKGK